MGTGRSTAMTATAVGAVALWLAAALVRDAGCCSESRVLAVVVLVVVALVGASTAGAVLAIRALGVDRLVHHVAQPVTDETDAHRHVLAVLGEWPGASTAEVAERTGRTRREIEVAVDELLASGRVERRWGGWHRREAGVVEPPSAG